MNKILLQGKYKCKNLILTYVCSSCFVHKEITSSILKPTCSIVFCCRRHVITDLNSSSPGFSYKVEAGKTEFLQKLKVLTSLTLNNEH